MKIRVSLLLVALVFIARINAETTRNQLSSLPGLSTLPQWQQYVGYIDIPSAKTTKTLFYWFVESQNDPSTDPVVVWMQGGPGCSSLIGFFQENGPWIIQDDGLTLELNPYSWNKNASVLYFEQPAGVGFSYSADPSGYTTTDNQTALDNYNFLLGWFEEFPEFSTNDLWITGESYGGVYVPTLAYQILTGQNSQIIQQFKGIQVGNPIIYCEGWKTTFFTIQLELYYWHGLVSFAGRQSFLNAGCAKNNSVECEDLFVKLVDAIGPHDIDDLYTNFCTGNGTLNFLDTVPKCFNTIARTPEYLNRPDVQQSLFIQQTPPAGHWQACTHQPTLTYEQSFSDILNYYNYIFDHSNLRVLIYSGDVDIADVPHAFTQKCLAQLKRQTVKEWARWTIPGPKLPEFNDSPYRGAEQNITAGYQEIYDKYTYATIRGAGHEAPQYQPLFAYTMFTRFVINGTSL